MSTSRVPYLVRGMYEWIADNGYTPHLLVNAEAEDVDVPGDYIEDGRITLNVSMSAVRGLELGNDRITFSARFGGRSVDISFPPSAVIAIYARENGEGMMFTTEESPGPDGGPGDGGASDDGGESAPAGRPKLRVVK